MGNRSLGTLTLDLIAKTGGFESGMDQAARVADAKTKQIQKQAQDRAAEIEKAFTGMAKSMAVPLAGAAIGISGIASLDALKHKIEDAIGGFAELKHAAEKTGASVENLSGLKVAGKLAGTDFAEVETAVTRLNKALHGTDDESKGAGKAIAAIGLDLQKLRTMDPAQAMLELAKAQEKFADGGGKSMAMMAILGKSGAAMIPFLHQLAEQGQLVGKVTTEQANAAIAYEKNVKRLEAAWGALTKQMAAAVVGPARDITDWMIKAQKDGGALEAVLVGIGAAMMKIGGMEISPLKMADQDANHAFADLAKAKKQLAEAQQFEQDKAAGKLIGPAWMHGVSSVDAAEKAVTEATARLNKALKARDLALKKAAEDGAPKDKSLNSQTFGAEPKEKKERASKDDPLGDLIAEIDAREKAYENAMGKFHTATMHAQEAIDGLTKAQKEYFELLQSGDWRTFNDSQKEAIRNAFEEADAMEKAEAEAARLKSLIEATPQAQYDKIAADLKLLADAYNEARITFEQYDQATKEAVKRLPKDTQTAKDGMIDLTIVANDAARAIADGFTSFLFDPMHKSIQDMLKSFLAAVAKMMVQAAALKAIKSAFSYFGFDGFAKGGAFDGGVQPFAVGGVVDSPTLFKFASGGSFKNGVMGEAGPEAILPLKRGADGKLGVTMNNAGAGDTVVNITINQDGTETAQSTGREASDARELATKIKGVVLDVLVTQQRPGGLLYR